MSKDDRDEIYRKKPARDRRRRGRGGDKSKGGRRMYEREQSVETGMMSGSLVRMF